MRWILHINPFIGSFIILNLCSLESGFVKPEDPDDQRYMFQTMYLVTNMEFIRRWAGKTGISGKEHE